MDYDPFEDILKANKVEIDPNDFSNLDFVVPTQPTTTKNLGNDENSSVSIDQLTDNLPKTSVSTSTSDNTNDENVNSLLNDFFAITSDEKTDRSPRASKSKFVEKVDDLINDDEKEVEIRDFIQRSSSLINTCKQFAFDLKEYQNFLTKMVRSTQDSGDTQNAKQNDTTNCDQRIMNIYNENQIMNKDIVQQIENISNSLSKNKSNFMKCLEIYKLQTTNKLIASISSSDYKDSKSLHEARQQKYQRFLDNMKSNECNVFIKELEEFIQSIIDVENGRDKIKKKIIDKKKGGGILNKLFKSTNTPTTSDDRQSNEITDEIINQDEQMIEYIKLYQLDQYPIEKRINTFMPYFINKLTNEAPNWKDAPLELVSCARDFLERYILLKLRKYTIDEINSENKTKDTELYKRLLDHQFVDFHHLEIKKEYLNQKLIDLAIVSLRKCEKLTCPAELIDNIMETHHLVNSMLHYITNDNKGCDDILPLFIYIIIRSKLTHIATILEIIDKYRDPKALQSAEGYCFISFSSAISFLENIIPEQLGLSQNDYQNEIELSRMKYQSAYHDTSRRDSSIDLL